MTLALAALGLIVTAGDAWFDLQGHRGARGLAPENTIAGFRQALEVGVTTLEMDASVTRDGVVVLSHDPLLNGDLTRDAKGEWLSVRPPIYSLDLAELHGYDVGRLRPGSHYAARFRDQRAVDGERIPTLAAVLELASIAPRMRFNVETKIDHRYPDRTPGPEEFAEAVIAVLQTAGVIDRSLLQSFDWRTLRHAKRVAPQLELSCLTVEAAEGSNVQIGQPGTPLHLSELDVDHFDGSVPRLVEAAGCAVWSPDFRDVTPSRLTEAHELGLRVIPWTVNHAEDVRRLVELGVDGLISDYPDRLRGVLANQNVPLPDSFRFE